MKEPIEEEFQADLLHEYKNKSVVRHTCRWLVPSLLGCPLICVGIFIIFIACNLLSSLSSLSQLLARVGQRRKNLKMERVFPLRHFLTQSQSISPCSASQDNCFCCSCFCPSFYSSAASSSGASFPSSSLSTLLLLTTRTYNAPQSILLLLVGQCLIARLHTV